MFIRVHSWFQLRFLGLSTTQIYTQVAIRKLKEIHTATHPAKVGNTTLDELKAEIDDDDS